MIYAPEQDGVREGNGIVAVRVAPALDTLSVNEFWGYVAVCRDRSNNRLKSKD